MNTLLGSRYGELPTPLSCQRLADFVATLMFYITAGHRFSGNLGSEAADPCFAPISRRVGQLCGPPRTMLDQAALFQGTGSPQPLVTEDYSHVLLDDAAMGAWRQMTTRMTALGVEVDARNALRRRPFKVFEPSKIEISIAV